MTKSSVFAAILLVTAVSGCTWVKLTPEGEQVVVMEAASSACERLGTTTSHGKADVASIDRNEDKVATELETLARNHAAGMGGNAIAADGPVTADGKRTYIVYNCS